MAVKEYEAWFLAALESLRGISGISRDAAPFEQDPESIKGAAERIRELMPPNRTYSKPIDQPEMTKCFEMSQAYKRCRSFRRLTDVVGHLMKDLGVVPEAWPPQEWCRA